METVNIGNDSSNTPNPSNESADPLTHLNFHARALIDKPVEDRVRAVFEDKWILYGGAKRILGILKDALAKPPSERPIGYLLIGPPGAGKTALINRLYRDLGGDPANRIGGAANIPILIVELMGRSTEPRTVLATARSLRLPIVTEQQSRMVTDIILRKLQERRVRMVVFLEFDNLKSVGRPERDVVFELLKNITNEGITIVAVGNEKCQDYVADDEPIASRLRPLFLQGLRNDDECRDFVATLETFYPFSRPSYLWREHADTIYKKTRGLIGEIVYLLNEAAAWALKNQRPCIDGEALSNCNYIEALAPPKLLKK